MDTLFKQKGYTIVESIQDLVIQEEKVSGIFETLDQKGLSNMTKSKVEEIICTSALCAFN